MGWAWIDSFYFMAMVATAQGLLDAPRNFWSKIFIEFMAFVSIGTLITVVGTLFGPFLDHLLQKEVNYAERDEHKKSSEEKGSGAAY